MFAILPSGGEMLLALVVGLLLFGGRLPEVAKDIGRVFFKMRRSLTELRRESGIDQTIRDLKREIDEAKPVVDLNPPRYQPWPGEKARTESPAIPVAAETDTDTDRAEDAPPPPAEDGPIERAPVRPEPPPRS